MAPGRQLPQAGADARGSGPHRSGRRRHRGGAQNATSQAQAVCWFWVRENQVLNQPEKGCGNDGRWKTRKTNSRFPSFPTALGNRCAIPAVPQPRRRLSLFLENQSQKGAPDIQPPPSGSSFDEKMLRCVDENGPNYAPTSSLPGRERGSLLRESIAKNRRSGLPRTRGSSHRAGAAPQSALARGRFRGAFWTAVAGPSFLPTGCFSLGLATLM